MQFPADTDSYVVIDVDQGSFSPELRWQATYGARVRIREGLLREGAEGVIVGNARSGKADRIFKANIVKAITEKREAHGDDYAILIDNEGPLVLFDGDREPEWYPGQAVGCLEYIPPSSCSGITAE